MRGRSGRERTSGSIRAPTLRALLLAALGALAAACSPPSESIRIEGPVHGAGTARFEILLGPGTVPGSLEVLLDGLPVSQAFAPSAWGASGELAVAPGREATLVARARFEAPGGAELREAVRRFTPPAPAPDLIESTPVAGAAAVPASAWLRLRFAGPVPLSTRSHFRLDCGSDTDAWRERAMALHALADDDLVVNPDAPLPPRADCALTWPGVRGREALLFATADRGSPVTVRYDRERGRSYHPYPDDFLTRPDAGTRTGLRLALPPAEGPNDFAFLFETLRAGTAGLDGASPIGHLVVELDAAPDLASLPLTPAESLDPMASVALLDLRPGDEFGRRVPFRLEPRSDESVLGVVSHSLLLFPSLPLEPGGRYGLVVTRRLQADPTRPFGPSPFLAAALGAPSPGESAAVARVRGLAEDVLAGAAAATPPIPREDVALAVRISVRSTDDIPADLLAIEAQVRAGPPPAFRVTEVVPESDPASPVAAIVRGTWEAPEWRSNGFLVRDASGVPLQQGTREIPFVLALPRAALSGPVPLTMYQHGNPGSAEEEVPRQGRTYLAEAGFAVAGFTDALNREVAPGESDDVARITAQVFAVFLPLTQFQRVPDYWVQTNAEQLAFLRLLEGFGSIDVLPIGAPDGIPELDPGLPRTYVGISEGANHAPGFLAYAPGVKAAALLVGGRRFTEVLIHQQAQVILEQIGGFFQSLTPAEVWTAMALFQAMFDAQDEHNHARFLYREPFAIGGTTRRASVLVVEGLDDSLVPNHATESLAHELGPLPHLGPVQRAVPFLQETRGPVQGNVDAWTTAAFYQYVPVGVPGIPPTPGCTVLSARSRSEGHYCAQGAAESRLQRVHFFQSALAGVPRIIDPLAP